MGLDLRSYNDEDSYEEYMSKGKSKVAICFVDMAIAVVLAVFEDDLLKADNKRCKIS